MQPRLAEKVTETHLKPNNFQKMKISVPLASQVIHKRVAGGVMAYATLGALPLNRDIPGKDGKLLHCMQWDQERERPSPAPLLQVCLNRRDGPFSAVQRTFCADGRVEVPWRGLPNYFPQVSENKFKGF